MLLFVALTVLQRIQAFMELRQVRGSGCFETIGPHAILAPIEAFRLVLHKQASAFYARRQVQKALVLWRQNCIHAGMQRGQLLVEVRCGVRHCLPPPLPLGVALLSRCALEPEVRTLSPRLRLLLAGLLEHGWDWPDKRI